MKTVLQKVGALLSSCLLPLAIYAQAPASPSELQTLGTRSWIRLSWQDNASNESGYRIYWSLSPNKPASPGAIIGANNTRYYIEGLSTDNTYYIWVEAWNNQGATAATTTAFTSRQWTLDPAEAANLSIPSSAAVPAGMQLFWQDEFNDLLLNRNKWSTNYYSTIDFKSGTQLSAMQHDSLPQPGIVMTGNSIRLIVNDTLPVKPYWPARKVSSIQTYDWRTNERYLDNSRGGYFEIRVRRSNTPNATEGLNLAYWLDAPGPDLKYYMEQGKTYQGVTGVRPRGQVFEIDVFEQNGNATSASITPFTMHGNVADDGTFQGNLTTYNASLSGQHQWHTHGLLWTASGIGYYIDGVLKRAWTDPNAIMSPDHFMNIFLGTYYGWKAGMTQTAEMEVDYIRGYQWPVTAANELPNAGFEYGVLIPWYGSGTLSANAKRSGNAGLQLAAGQSVSQYVYLPHSSSYQLKYWLKGNSTLQVKMENLTPVTGVVQNTYQMQEPATAIFRTDSLAFTTGTAYGDHMKTVRITFTNTGTGTLIVDDLSLAKGGNGGSIIACTPSGGPNARDRYITALTTVNAAHNINYTNNSYPVNGYGEYSNDTIVAAAGSTFTLHITNSPNTKWARMNVYADWNGNGSFTDAGELLFSAGGARQDNSSTVLNISRSITVPAAAAGKARMRVRSYDAWNNDPGACGAVDYTTTQDFFVNTQGNQLGLAKQTAGGDVGEPAIQVYPNPITGGSFQLQLWVPRAARTMAGIYDLSGRRMMNIAVDLTKGSNRIPVKISTALPSGVYTVHVPYEGKVLQYKFVKQ